jgi:hypothetical protein
VGGNGWGVGGGMGVGGGGGVGVALVSAERPVGGRRMEGQGGSLMMLYSVLRYGAG